jgi:hypothetical protein
MKFYIIYIILICDILKIDVYFQVSSKFHIFSIYDIIYINRKKTYHKFKKEIFAIKGKYELADLFQGLYHSIQ